jgi:D-3-phosphoglycerate dehydrogenase
MKVLLATEKPFVHSAVCDISLAIKKAGLELVILDKYTVKTQLLDAVKDADAVIVRSDKIDAEVFDAAGQLKIIVRAGAGYDNIDLEAATKHNVCVMNTPGQNANAVAELVFGLLIYGARNFYNGSSGIELKGKSLGIHAYGNVGRNVARIAKGFEMRIYGFDPYYSYDDLLKDDVYRLENHLELFCCSDIVSLHVPLTPETKQSIDYHTVSLFPKNGILVNTARKEIINESELVAIMKDRPDIKYLTDIKPDNHAEMLELFPDRYFSTPKKMGAQTEEANLNAGVAAAEQIIRFLNEGDETFRVNKK